MNEIDSVDTYPVIKAPPKLCKDCRWCHVPWWDYLFIPRRPYEFATCRASRTDESSESLVDGRASVYDRDRYCAIERSPYARCGPEATLWAPRYPRQGL